MSDITAFFAHVGGDPLTCAFEEEKRMSAPARAAPDGRAPAGMEERRFEEMAEQAYRDAAGRPLALYVHIPFCRHRCVFCPFFKNRTHETFSEEYSALVSKEIADTASALGKSIRQRQVNTIYFGGGTPSDLNSDDMARLIRQLRETFSMAEDVEITVEGRIRGFTRDKAMDWVKAGANRFSLGVQTTDTRLRRRMGRISDREEIRKILDGLCQSGATVVVDLIYGFPEQTGDMLAEDVRFLSEETNIHGLDLYKLNLFPDSPLDKAIKMGSLPAQPAFVEQAKMYGIAYDRLIAYGYEPFAPKHWRRDTRERSVYNRLARGQTDMIPFGSGAGGRLGSISIGNTGALTDYESRVAAGEKPVGRMVRSPLLADQHGFNHTLDTALEELTLPSLEKWPENYREMGEKLLSQWRQAGLWSDENDERHMKLTRAGNFWSAHMRKRLLDFVSSPVAHGA
ncbi:MAG: heme anaerobic degradation radical SAM methyltransferase ChuW/HutW [Burkholderiaceae bacterium]|nr:heme anaerobic degradation radical SAM methyltransferase ChuW/HutW [Burkholderiaceae bacterium]